MAITVALVDDRVLFRKGLRELLLLFGDIEIQLEADNETLLLRQLKKGVPIPDVCIISP